MTSLGVYADWLGLATPTRLGLLHGRKNRARESFEFQYDPAALADPSFRNLQLDPAIVPYEGPQFPPPPQDRFGAFADSSPDRWGRLLMDRRHQREIRAGIKPAGSRLHESDYLLGVHDLYRVGALRYKRDDAGAFMDDRIGVAAPPFAEIRTLERAARALEQDADNTDPQGQQWLRMLIAPGGSLGGARPKASVADEQGHLFIAKFPSTRDQLDVGGWEMVVNTLAVACGLDVAFARAQRFASDHHCFMVRRFDRTQDGKRLHFASAMTLTGHVDGDDASTGVSYQELAAVLINQGAQTNTDLRELWSRIVFNMLVSNADDHLRNHGFILEPGAGWRLSQAYDMNPDPDADDLKLNITESDNAMDLELAREVASVFRLKLTQADEVIEGFQSVVRQWKTIADDLGLPAREQERMASAFRLARN